LYEKLLHNDEDALHFFDGIQVDDFREDAQQLITHWILWK